MDPRKQECFDRYLYGAGYFARDDNTLGLLTGNDSNVEHFCLSCPRRAQCESAQQARVRQQQPGAVERYERAVRAALGEGFSELLAALALARQGENPYYNDAMESFASGHADRGQSAGLLVKGKRGG